MEMGVSHTKLPCGSKDRDREREKERAKDGRDEIMVRFGIGYRFCEMKDVEKTKRASVHFMSDGRHGGCMSKG